MWYFEKSFWIRIIKITIPVNTIVCWSFFCSFDTMCSIYIIVSTRHLLIRHERKFTPIQSIISTRYYCRWLIINEKVFAEGEEHIVFYLHVAERIIRSHIVTEKNKVLGNRNRIQFTTNRLIRFNYFYIGKNS